MAEEKEVKLRCGVYGEGAVFPVKIARDAKVSALQKAIFYKMGYNHQSKFDPSMLTLYLARRKGQTTWMKHDHNTESFLQGGIDTDYDKMLSSWGLDDEEYLGPDFTTGDGDIQELPEAAVRAGVLAWSRKRKFSEEKLVKLEDLWDYSKMKIAALPNATELKAILQQPLPFRLTLDDDEIAEKICDKTGEVLQCKNLTMMIESYLFECKGPLGSSAFENTWQAFYDALFRIPSRICLAKGIYLTCRRNFVDDTGRPDRILHYYGMVLLRGEEKSSSTVIDVSCKELTKKMRKWNPMFYGDLPYILGYATSGPRLEIVTIDRHLRAEKVVEFYSITAQKEEVIKTFYNLSFFLVEMIAKHKRTCSNNLMPYTPDITKRRTIELMDDVVQRTIQRLNEDDFGRLIGIYKALQGLNSRGHGKTHLQTVRTLELPDEQSSSFTVQLQPLGFSREPGNVEEVHEWLQGMLTGLKFWHGCNYCHGDLQWRNIVYVPTSDRGYWVLIDMDESHPPNTTTISWNHQCHGEILTFQHDLFQLGRLMEDSILPLTDELLSVQSALLSARTSQLDAEQVLTMMNQNE